MSMHQAATAPAISALMAWSGVLAKGAAFAEARKIDPAILLGSRLRPDMFPLTRQVQVACDMVKNGCARLAGVSPPAMADTEASFAELQQRIEKTVDYLRSFAPADIDGSEERQIVMKVGGKEMRFAGQFYLQQFVMPNLFFHTTTAYLILRFNGVDLGKRDFLGPLDAEAS
jgi:hypothetical protein